LIIDYAFDILFSLLFDCHCFAAFLSLIAATLCYAIAAIDASMPLPLRHCFFHDACRDYLRFYATARDVTRFARRHMPRFSALLMLPMPPHCFR